MEANCVVDSTGADVVGASVETNLDEESVSTTVDTVVTRSEGENTYHCFHAKKIKYYS